MRIDSPDALSTPGRASGSARAQAAALSEAVKNALYAALDDEHKAYATYWVIMDKFGAVRPFVNIAEAEQRHIAALERIMTRYGIATRKNPYLSGERPLPPAPASIKEACEAGVKAEEDNLTLYDKHLIPAAKGYGDIVTVFTQLRDASANRHRVAFERCAAGSGRHRAPVSNEASSSSIKPRMKKALPKA